MAEPFDHKNSGNRVTIVVPVYGDWPSLRNCVQSLIEHADPVVFDILLVNDCGPDADEIEAGLRGLIYGMTNFSYVRNPENLGFVRTCNRAAYELDQSGNDILLLNSDTIVTHGALEELRAVLNLSDKHAVVCPRSNDATIATIPFFPRTAGAVRAADRSHVVFEHINQYLPRYYIAPVAIGFCFLVRRSVIDEHGLFDEIFGQGYNEENDFCLRVNALGFSSVISNHAYVFHAGSASFGSEQRATLEAKNSRVLHQRYPFYPAAVVSFIQHEYTAVDRFSDLLVPDSQRSEPKILVDLSHLSSSSATEADPLVLLLGAIAEDGGSVAVSVTIAATMAISGLFDLPRYGFTVIDTERIDEVFDVGIAAVPEVDVRRLSTLNRHCLRWMFTGSGNSAHTTWSWRVEHPESEVVARTALEHAERVVVSDTADHDYRAFWRRAVEVSTTEVDLPALQRRDSAVRDLSLVWEALHDPLREVEAELSGIKGSRSFALANRIAAFAATGRRITRRRA